MPAFRTVGIIVVVVTPLIYPHPTSTLHRRRGRGEGRGFGISKVFIFRQAVFQSIPASQSRTVAGIPQLTTLAIQNSLSVSESFC